MSSLLEKNKESLNQEPASFKEALTRRWQAGHFVCVGLDSQYERLPASIRSRNSVSDAILTFNQEIAGATHDLVGAYKLNSAFYEAQGADGLIALIKTVQHIRLHYPEIPVILDAKRADIGNTNLEYLESAFKVIGADAITVHPYLGQEALRPFLDQEDKGIIVLCRTSNPGAGELQDLIVDHPELGRVPFYQVIAFQVARYWNTNKNCCLVVGATYPDELALVRQLAPELPILIPGIGKQGGDLEKTVKAGKDLQDKGILVNSSRGIIFAFASSQSDFAQAARTETEKLAHSINQFL